MSYSAKYVGFWLSFLLPTIVFFLCPIILFVGRNRYARSPPTGSVFATAIRLWRYAAKGRWSLNPVKTVRQLRADDFWENVKPTQVAARNGGVVPSWMTFDDQWVAELRRGIKACTVFVWFPLWCKLNLELSLLSLCIRTDELTLQGSRTTNLTTTSSPKPVP
jgi:POT family proton-dependent oligopeptide transporter